MSFPDRGASRCFGRMPAGRLDIPVTMAFLACLLKFCVVLEIKDTSYHSQEAASFCVAYYNGFWHA